MEVKELSKFYFTLPSLCLKSVYVNATYWKGYAISVHSTLWRTRRVWVKLRSSRKLLAVPSKSIKMVGGKRGIIKKIWFYQLSLLCKLATVLRVSKADGSLSQHLHSGRQFKVWCWLKMGTLEERDGSRKETVWISSLNYPFLSVIHTVLH